MSEVQPSLAGPKRPQDRVLLSDMKANFHDNVGGMTKGRKNGVGCAVHKLDAEGGDQPQAQRLAAKPVSKIELHNEEHDLTDGSVVIAAITSCTNTSNPAEIPGAALPPRQPATKALQAP